MGERSAQTALVWLVVAAVVAFALWRLAGESGDGGGSPVQVDRAPQGAGARAGGPSRKADLTAVNLAAEVEDGQQVVVPARGAAGTVAGGVVLEPGTPGAPRIGLGIVTAEQLDELDGIGPTLSERIVEYRTENGGFGSLEELREVEGIGEKRFETLREALQP